MRIIRITAYQVTLTVPSLYKLSGGRLFETLDSTVVSIETDAGLVGWGEACPFGVFYGAAHGHGVRAGVAELAPRLVGMNPMRVERINDFMDEVLPGLNYVKSALDMACWDILGKALDQPVCELMGGRSDHDLWIAASVSTGTPEEVVTNVQRFRDIGYRCFSVKVGGEDPSLDVARVQAVMKARQPNEEYILDANRGWSLEAALRFASLLGPADAWVEQPCKTYRECLSFKRRSGLPLSLDEILTGPDILLQALADDAIDAANLKTTKVGGLTKMRRMRDVCHEAGIAMSLQETGGSDIAFAALCHVAQSTNAALCRHIWDPRELAAETLAHGAPVVEGGKARAGSKPGLGIDVIVDALGDPVAVYE